MAAAAGSVPARRSVTNAARTRTIATITGIDAACARRSLRSTLLMRLAIAAWTAVEKEAFSR